MDQDLIGIVPDETPLCGQDEIIIIIDGEHMSCDGFIDFTNKKYNIYDCPKFKELCSNDVGCESGNLASEYNYYALRSDEIDASCNYVNICKNNKEDYKYEYAAQKIGQLIERCLYVSDTNFEFDLDCYRFNYTNIDKAIYYDAIFAVAKYSKSYYDSEEILRQRISDMMADSDIDDNIEINKGEYSTILEGLVYKMVWHEKLDENDLQLGGITKAYISIESSVFMNCFNKCPDKYGSTPTCVENKKYCNKYHNTCKDIQSCYTDAQCSQYKIADCGSTEGADGDEVMPTYY